MMAPFSPREARRPDALWVTSGRDADDESKAENRGEAFVAAQGILIASVVIGRFPFGDNAAALWGGVDVFLAQHDFWSMAIGTSALFSGLCIMYLSAKELEGSLSHWAVPVDKSEGGKGLVSTGVYGLVRHPMYIGLLSMLAGLGIATQSVLRLMLTMTLFIILEFKATYEEEKLTEAYPGEYDDYKKKVKGKILPISLL